MYFLAQKRYNNLCEPTNNQNTLSDIKNKKNLKVNVWTVDDEKNLRKLEEMGVDYITTNVFQQKD